MKKVILSSVLAAAAVSAGSPAYAAATSLCNAGVSASAAAQIVSAATSFVKVAFTPRCSANVHLAYDEVSGGNYLRVGSASAKGGRAFMGSTAGGGIVSVACASTTVCVAADATSAATNAANPTSG